MNSQKPANFPKFYAPQIMNYLNVSKADSEQAHVQQITNNLATYIYPQLDYSPKKNHRENIDKTRVINTEQRLQSSQIKAFLSQHQDKYKQSLQNSNPILLKGPQIASINQRKKTSLGKASKDKQNQFVDQQFKTLQNKNRQNQDNQLRQLNIRQNQPVKMSPLSHANYRRKYGNFNLHSPYKSPYKSAKSSRSPKTYANYFYHNKQQNKKIPKSPIIKNGCPAFPKEKYTSNSNVNLAKGKNVSMGAMNNNKNMNSQHMNTRNNRSFHQNNFPQLVPQSRTPIKILRTNGGINAYNSLKQKGQYQKLNKSSTDLASLKQVFNKTHNIAIKPQNRTDVQGKVIENAKQGQNIHEIIQIKNIQKNATYETNSFALCQNGDGRKAKYFILQSEQQNVQKFYCSKCAIEFVQNGFEVQQIPITHRTTVATVINSKQNSRNSSPTHRNQAKTPSRTVTHAEYLKSLLTSKLNSLSQQRKQYMSQINQSIDQIDAYYLTFQRVLQEHRLTNHHQILCQRHEIKKNFEKYQRKIVQGVQKINQIINFEQCLQQHTKKGHKRAKSNFQIKRQKETIKDIHSLLQKSFNDFDFKKQFDLLPNLNQKLVQGKQIVESYIALNFSYAQLKNDKQAVFQPAQSPKGYFNFMKSKLELKEDSKTGLKMEDQNYKTVTANQKKFNRRQSLINNLYQLSELTEENQEIQSDSNMNSIIINDEQSSSQLQQLKLGQFYQLKAKKPFRALFNDNQSIKSTDQKSCVFQQCTFMGNPKKQCLQTNKKKKNSANAYNYRSILANPNANLNYGNLNANLNCKANENASQTKQRNIVSENLINYAIMNSDQSIKLVYQSNDNPSEAFTQHIKSIEIIPQIKKTHNRNNPQTKKLIKNLPVSFSQQVP